MAIEPMSVALPPPPALVLGATSLIGFFLTQRLSDGCISFVAVSRQPPHLDRGWLQADLTDPDFAARLPSVATVYALNPIWLLPLALDALKAAGMSRLVAFSSTSRFTKLQSSDAAERAVARRLAASEAEVEAFCKNHAIAWTILRPTMIYAEGRDANVTRLAGLIRRFGILPISGRGEGLRQPVHAEDLAVAAIAAANTKAAWNRAYDLPGGESLSYRELTGRIFDSLIKTRLIINVPAFLWRLLFALARPWLPGANAAMGDRMVIDRAFDGTLATRDFGWAPRAFRPKF